MGSSAITLAGMLAPAQFRNKIINGNFDIWQRGITFGAHDGSLVYGPLGGATGSNGLAKLTQIRINPYVSPIAQKGGGQADGDIIKDQAYTADRWRLMNRDGWKGHVVRKEFDWSDVDDLLPAGSSPARYYMEHSVEAESNNSSMTQRIEDVTIFNNEKITVSFYARRVPTSERPDSTLNRIQVDLIAYTECTGSNINNGGISDSPDNSPLHNEIAKYKLYNDSSETLVLSDDWKKFTYTFTIPQMAGKLDGNGNAVTPGEGFWVIGMKPWSSGGDPWLGAVHYAQVQVEKRDDTTEFEVLPPGIELQRCQRYFQKSLNLEDEPGSDYSSVGAGQAWSSIGYSVDNPDPFTGFPNGGHIADDAVGVGTPLENTTESRAYNMWGVRVGRLGPGPYSGNDGTGNCSSIDFKIPMRATPEVLMYNPDDGTRGYVYIHQHGNLSSNTNSYQSKEIEYIKGISKNQACTPVIFDVTWYGDNEDMVEASFAYYWTADAEL